MTASLTRTNLTIFNQQNNQNIQRLPPSHKLSLSHSSRSNQYTNYKSHDEVCQICNQWAFNNKDFLNNFLKCNNCPNSYHYHCINKNRTNLSSFNCSQTNQSCNKNRNHVTIKLFKFMDDTYFSKYYQYQQDRKKIFYEIKPEQHQTHNHNQQTNDNELRSKQ